METFVALLRAVNVGGTQLPMAELRRILGELGCQEVRTYLQSGNAVFAAVGRPRELADAIETRIERDIGPRVGVLVLSAGEMGGVVAGNPFLGEAGLDEKSLHVTFLFEGDRRLDDLALPAADGERALLVGAPTLSRPVVYLYLPHGYGRSKLTNAFFERRLGTAATTRNWRTTLALAELAAPAG